MYWKHNLPAFLWAAMILLLCGIPGENLPDTSYWDFLHLDKLAHAGMFAILTVLMIVGHLKQHSSGILRYYAKSFTVLVSVLYGVLIEIGQRLLFVDRDLEVYDMLGNALGALLGVVAFRVIYGNNLPY